MGHCAAHHCGAAAPAGKPLAAEDTFDNSTPWKFYNHLIAGIPEGIRVLDCCLGRDWCYVDAECGMGMGHVFSGGAARTFGGDVRDFELHQLAQLAKSWNLGEASIGVAALNAWYSQPEKIVELGGTVGSGSEGLSADPFDPAVIDYAGKKVVMVGHFPNAKKMSEICDLTVLERNCNSPLDVPDMACEYVVPAQDVVFLTGTTIINKTAPRLLDLAKGARTVMVGPSTVPSPFLFKWGIDALGGSVVTDREAAKASIKLGGHRIFHNGAQKYLLRNPS